MRHMIAVTKDCPLRWADCLRPHDARARVHLAKVRQTEQARPPSGHPNHQGTVTCPKPDTLWGSPQGDVELMAEKKVLDFKPAWWLEQIGYEGRKQVDDRKHRVG